MAFGDDLDPAVRHAARREHSVRDALQLVASPLHHDDLETSAFVEVDVQCRPHAIAELVLDIREPLGELAHVMIVYERECGHRPRALRHLSANDLRAHQIPQQFGSRDAALGYDDVEVFEERPLHGDAEPHQIVDHLRRLTHQSSEQQKAVVPSAFGVPLGQLSEEFTCSGVLAAAHVNP
jgi:hypothetical protein